MTKLACQKSHSDSLSCWQNSHKIPPFSEDVQIYSQQRQNLSRPSFCAPPYISAQGEKKRGQSGAGRGNGKRSKICHITSALINTRLVMSAKTDENLPAPLTLPADDRLDILTLFFRKNVSTACIHVSCTSSGIH